MTRDTFSSNLGDFPFRISHFLYFRLISIQGCLMTGCLNGGSCLSDDKKQTFTCWCTQPWTGEKCEYRKSKKQFCRTCISYFSCLMSISCCYVTDLLLFGYSYVTAFLLLCYCSVPALLLLPTALLLHAPLLLCYCYVLLLLCYCSVTAMLTLCYCMLCYCSVTAL